MLLGGYCRAACRLNTEALRSLSNCDASMASTTRSRPLTPCCVWECVIQLSAFKICFTRTHILNSCKQKRLTPHMCCQAVSPVLGLQNDDVVLGRFCWQKHLAKPILDARFMRASLRMIESATARHDSSLASACALCA